MPSERTALITGGMGCLGEAIAQALHDSGHRVIVTHSPGRDDVQSWLDAHAVQGRRYLTYEMDVADEASCDACAERVRADGHAVDVLVNNAGITRDATFRKMHKVDWDAVMHTNLDSLFNVTKAFIGGMVDRGWGRVVNIASVNGSKGAFGQTNYAASKAGMHGFTKSLALELAGKGVTVNTVSPGYLQTRMVMQVPEDVLKSKVLSQIPLGRLGRTDEVAALVAFVCSDAAAFMTGANLAMNGGQHMA
ncbi:acetoacetyl-CoA reductase [Dyella sp. KRB-257]|uniref:acetoacetyl-CoA reductase n=1 Tax=Dyella sp. KRB-257 TaxID=3400915 RepID=UPI003C00CC8F